MNEKNVIGEPKSKQSRRQGKFASKLLVGRMLLNR